MSENTVELLRCWEKFELGMEAPPPLSLGKVADELARLRRVNAKLVEALEPFGCVDGEGDEDFPDLTRATVVFGRSTHHTMTLGDFRKARSALALHSELGKR